MNSIARLWLSPALPEVHLPKLDGEGGHIKRILSFARGWLYHPVKRWLAKIYLSLLRKLFGLKVIGITGSAGKTSTKDMLASILSKHGKTIYSYSNIDPVFNIPATILKCTPATKYLIIEMGIEFPNEMDFYLWMATPDIGVVTNVFPTHTLFLVDRQGVANEKGKLISALSNNGLAILNYRDTYCKKMAGMTKARVLFFNSPNAGISATDVRVTEKVTTKFTLKYRDRQKQIVLPMVGEQFVSNALAASTVGIALGIELTKIKQGLETFVPPKHRMSPKWLNSGCLVIDDTYNSNPLAAIESLKTFKEISKSKRRVIVLGQMMELGTYEQEGHTLVAKEATSLNPDFLICIGPKSDLFASVAKRELGKNKVAGYNTWNEALTKIITYNKPNTAILVKGSRSLGLDSLIDNLA